MTGRSGWILLAATLLLTATVTASVSWLKPMTKRWQETLNVVGELPLGATMRGVGRACVRTKADLKACVQAGLRRIQKSPWLIRMFFLLPDTQYAAR